MPLLAEINDEYMCIALKPRTIDFSGNVTINGTGTSRKILAYRRRTPDVVLYEGVSESDGTFEFELNGNYHDDFRVIAVGHFGENSAIAERVSELGGE